MLKLMDGGCYKSYFIIHVKMLTLNERHNPNYIAQVVKIGVINSHPNADRLQIATINFQPVIVWSDVKVWDVGIYFPVESKISDWFLRNGNMYDNKDLNRDKEKKWYIWKRWRVRACKLRWEYSMWLFVPVEDFHGITWEIIRSPQDINVVFDTVDKWLLIQKYEQPPKGTKLSPIKKWTKPQQSRLIDWQVHLHIDTENLRNNAFKLNLDDIVSITYKYHWTNATFQNVLVRKKTSIFWRLFINLLGKWNDTEYDVVYTSRKVVKNKSYETSKLWYYSSDPWAETLQEIGNKIPQWVCLYWEIVWYQSTWAWIQKPYDYWCDKWKHRFIVYRVAFTNPQWLVYNLNTVEAKKYVEKLWLDHVEILYSWSIVDLLESLNIDSGHHWQENLVVKLEELYNDKDCFVCENSVPEEWIVLRVEDNEWFNAYKLKSRRFLEYETKMLDKSE